MMWTLVAITAAALAAACDGAGPTGRPQDAPAGSWGGEHVALDVTSAGAAVELDCAHGTIDAPLRLDDEGRFSIAGVFVREGGPVRFGETEQAHPAVYDGRLEDSKITFSIRLTDSDTAIGPFTAMLGAEPTLFKCQ